MSMIGRNVRALVSTPHGAVLVTVFVVVSTVLSVAAVRSGDQVFWGVLCTGLTAIALSAAWCTAAAARAGSGRQRAAWVFQTIGLVGWAAGAALSISHRLGSALLPMAAHAGYVLFWLSTCVALLMMPVARFDPSRTRVVLDAVIVGAALFEVAWLLLLRATVELHSAADEAEILSLTQLLATVVVVTVAMSLVMRARGGQRRVLLLLTLGIVVMALTRATFVHVMAEHAFTHGVLIGTGWAVGLFVLGVAGERGGRGRVDRDSSTVPSRTSLWLPYIPVVLAAAVLTSQFVVIPQLAPVLLTFAVMVGAVLIRQFLVLLDNRRLQQAAAEQALRDSLTGAGNRALFHDRLTHATHLWRRDRVPLTVLLVDLDDFKLVNDSMGHAAGDSLLIAVAERLLGCLRTGDTVARLGGDEFALLMEGSVEDSRAVAHRVMQAFDEPFPVDGHQVRIRPSVGLAVAAADEDVEVSPADLLKRADAAMYAAKRSGVGGLRAFSPELQAPDGRPLVASYGWDGAGRPSTEADLRLLGELRSAIDHGELAVVYQPKVDLDSGGVVGFEALVRWPHRELGVLEPDQFLDVVRRYRLMPALTDAVLLMTLDDLAAWQARGLPTSVAVNLFAPSLADLDLPRRVSGLLAERGLAPERLTVEITEDLLLHDVDRTRAVLGELRTQGIRIAIDDFGSGYSALSYLREFPADEMKICRQLVSPVVVDQRAEAVVRAVTELAHVLGAEVVAEGVEDEATSVRLRQLGCDVGQGYHYFRPMVSDAVAALLTTQSVARFENSVIG
jgi:diguanylate cyclase (GGDEF)-like protein